MDSSNLDNKQFVQNVQNLDSEDANGSNASEFSTIRNSLGDSSSIFSTELSVMPPRIALYNESQNAPLVVPISTLPHLDAEIPRFIDTLAAQLHTFTQEQGGRLPFVVLQELVTNLIHAGFCEVVITILDGGNTIRFSDRGPGIANKESALRPGFTSADAKVKPFIRGVGSGFAVVKEALDPLGGTLSLEDNLGKGTVVTAHIPPQENEVFAASEHSHYSLSSNLSERQLKTLLLVVELTPVGPTQIARELGISPSTAYRDLRFLEKVGLVDLSDAGYRSITEEGQKYVDAVF